MIEFRKSITDLYKEAFDNIGKAYDNKDDLLSDRQSYIEKYMELLELQGKGKPASAYTSLIAEEEAKLASNRAQLVSLQKSLAESMRNGVKQGSDEWVEMESKIRDVEAAILDNKVAIEQYKKELKELKVEAFELFRTAYDNRSSYYDNQINYVEGYIDYLDAMGIDATPEIYQKLIEIEKQKQQSLVEDVTNARSGLAKLEAAGYTAADQEWNDANNKIVELEKSIQDCDISIAKWNQTIKELDTKKFDEFIERTKSFNNELSNVYDLISDEDVAFEDNSWTKEGITSLAMLYHQIENNKQVIEEYNKEMEKLNAEYKAGKINEIDYTDRMTELRDEQWELVKSNKDLKDSIMDINEARVDIVEDGIQKEIDAYQELIDLKKDELDAERDLYSFRRDVQKQTKDIAELERKIAALSGDTSDSAKAERRKLEAQLREAKEGLDDTYYDRAKDIQLTALDNEMEAYQKSADDYIEQLRLELENIEATVQQTLSDVLFNADVTLNELNSLASVYNITFTENLINPWIQMSAISTSAKEQIGLDLLSLNEDNIAMFSDYAGTLLVAPFEQGGMAATQFKTITLGQIKEIKSNVYNASSDLIRDLSNPWTGALAPVNTFSESVRSKLNQAVGDAKQKESEMENSLSQPWESSKDAINTWSATVEAAYNKAIQKANEYAAATNKAQNIQTPTTQTPTTQTPTYITIQNPNSSGNGGNGTTQQPTTNNSTYMQAYREKEVLPNVYASGLYKNGYGVEIVTINGQQWLHSVTPTNGGATISKYYKVSDLSVVKDSNGNKLYSSSGNKITAYRKYAKGTLGTKKDQLAVTDEPQFGDELVLVPTKSGNLSFMRKGTGVVPAKLTEEIMDIANVGLDGLMNSNQTSANINMVSNAISKPELNFAFDSLVHVDHCDEGTLGSLEKMVDAKINDFSKRLNYAIKRYK